MRENVNLTGKNGDKGGNYYIQSNDLINKTLVILRKNERIYFYYENADDIVLLLDVSNINTFDTPVTIGCSLNSSGNPFRFFEGKISDIQIYLYDEDLDFEFIERPIYTKLYGDTLTFSSTASTLSNKALTKDYGEISQLDYNKNSNSPGANRSLWYNERTSIKYVEILDEIKPNKVY